MKKLIIATFALVLFLPLRADDLFQNNDFSQGKDHWDGKYKVADVDGASGSGKLILQLQEHEWTSLSQTIEGKPKRTKYVVRYTLSADTVFSHDPDEYKNIGPRIGLPNSFNMNGGPEAGIIYHIDPDNGREISSNPFKLKIGTPDPAIFEVGTGSNSDNTRQTEVLVFPPGHGTLTLFQVSATDYLADPHPPAGDVADTLPAHLDVKSDNPTKELINNGDFSHGTAGWDGDGKDASQASGDDRDSLPNFNATPTDAPKPGLLIKLKPTDWSNFSQSISCPSTKGTLSVTYEMAPGTTLKDERGGSIKFEIPGLGTRSIKGSGSGFYIFTTSEESQGGEILTLHPEASLKTETLRFMNLHTTHPVRLQFVIAPGQGSITIRKISATAE